MEAEVWNFTVKPKQIMWSRELLNGLCLPSQFRQDNKIQKKKSFSKPIVKTEKRSLCNFFLFLTKFLSVKVSKLGMFCKQKQWRENSVMPVGVYQSELPDYLKTREKKNKANIGYYLLENLIK